MRSVCCGPTRSPTPRRVIYAHSITAIASRHRQSAARAERGGRDNWSASSTVRWHSLKKEPRDDSGPLVREADFVRVALIPIVVIGALLILASGASLRDRSGPDRYAALCRRDRSRMETAI